MDYIEKKILLLTSLPNDEGFYDLLELLDNKIKFKSIRNLKGQSLLHIAVGKRNNKIVKLLLDYGINPNIKDNSKNKNTALMSSLKINNIEGALLILNSINLKKYNITNKYNEFSILGENKKIQLSDYKKITLLLIKHGFDQNSLDNKNMNLSHYAVKENNLNKLTFCLEQNISINLENRLLLQFAMFQKPPNNKIIKFIIDNGAKLVMDDYNALTQAHMLHNPEIFEYLIKNYNMLDTLNNEELLEIIEHKEIEFLKFLWKIPLVHDFIITHNLTKAFPEEIRELFIF